METMQRQKVRRNKGLIFLIVLISVACLMIIIRQPLVYGTVMVALIPLSRRIMLDNRLKVPAFCYHSVSDNPAWMGKPGAEDISLSVGLFERQIEYLKKHGYNTISLSDLYRHLKYGMKLPPKPVILTFDDGYLDNWVSVYPTLKKYGLQGTLFVPTGKILPANQCRPNLEDVWRNRATPQNIAWEGYLSWAEVKRMDASGVLDVQSHTVTHAKKREILTEFIGDDGGYRRRVYTELAESKQTLEQRLNKAVNFLAWPGEDMNRCMFDIAVNEAGYLATTGFRGFNTHGEPPEAISRVFVHNNFCGLKSDFFVMLGFKSQLHLAEGNFFYYLICGLDFLWAKWGRNK